MIKILLLFFIIAESLIADDKNLLDIQKMVFAIQKKSYTEHTKYKSQYSFKDAIEFFKKSHLDKYPFANELEIVIENIAKKRPKYMTKEVYIKFLDDYIQFLISGKKSYIYGEYLFYAKLFLFKIREIAPNRVETYRDLADVYMGLYLHYKKKFIHATPKMSAMRGATKNDGGHNITWTATYKAKKNYQIYVQKCKEQNIEPKLTKEIEFILKRDRIFFEIYSTFDGVYELHDGFYDGFWVPNKTKSKKKMYKEEYKNICKEYVASLNRMPDRDYIRCMRYNFEDNSSFRYYFKRDSNMSKELIELYIKRLETKQYLGEDRGFNFKRGMYDSYISYVFKYKDEFFIADDSIFRLFQGKELNMNPNLYNLCYFGFVDFRKKGLFNYLEDDRDQKIFLEEEGEKLWQ